MIQYHLSMKQSRGSLPYSTCTIFSVPHLCYPFHRHFFQKSSVFVFSSCSPHILHQSTHCLHPLMETAPSSPRPETPCLLGTILNVELTWLLRINLSWLNVLSLETHLSLSDFLLLGGTPELPCPFLGCDIYRKSSLDCLFLLWSHTQPQWSH